MKDSVMRLLTKHYKLQEGNKCGSIIGVDDYAFKNSTLTGPLLLMKLPINHLPYLIDGMAAL